MVIKIDLLKPYDSVECLFLKNVSLELGIPMIMINWIMKCVTIVLYSILVNGYPLAPFKARKILRQEDSVSPYLFAMRIEYFSRCLSFLKDTKYFSFRLKCRRSTIRLMFADDLLITSKGHYRLVISIHELIKKFSEAQVVSKL